MASIRDVARRAGVSISTVSAVISGKKRVSSELQQRVLKAIEELDYRPNALARAIFTRRTKTIAFLSPSVSNPGFANALRGAEERARQAGYSVLVGNTDGSREILQEHCDRLLEMRVDGVLVSLTWEVTSSSVLEQFHRHNIPVVGLSGGRPVKGIPCFLADEEASGEELGRYLGRLGHRRCAFVGPADSAVTSLRIRGLRRGLAHSEGELPDELVVQTDVINDEAGKESVQRLLAGQSDFTCIVVFNDYMAAGVLESLREQGFRVPAQISVATFGDFYARLTYPKLTTMAYPETDAGRMAAEALLAILEGKEVPPETTLIKTRLVLRNSTHTVA